jgi:pimeloyl-ACP methyl ester carboxylesterase
VQPSEHAAYFAAGEEQLYTVRHGVENPVGRVLLVGPFGADRHYSYIPWVAWARFLAAHNLEVLRYDYRGAGESSGTFSDFTFVDWIDDVRRLAGWLREQSPSLPLVIHGLELGALLASEAFHQGFGDALLLWSPPASGSASLKATLLRTVAQENLFKEAGQRKPFAEYLRPFESGEAIEVDGYRWSAKLWKDAGALVLPETSADLRVRSVKLDSRAAPLVKGTAVGYEAIHKDFTALFTESAEWIKGRCAPVLG